MPKPWSKLALQSSSEHTYHMAFRVAFRYWSDTQHGGVPTYLAKDASIGDSQLRDRCSMIPNAGLSLQS